jgi:hypothetical protein
MLLWSGYQSFDIKMTSAEMGALRNRFDRDGNNYVNGGEFQAAFFKLSDDEHAAAEQERQIAVTRRRTLTVRAPAPNLVPRGIESALTGVERNTLAGTVGVSVDNLAALREKYKHATREDDDRPGSAPEMTGSGSGAAFTGGRAGVSARRPLSAASSKSAASLRGQSA